MLPIDMCGEGAGKTSYNAGFHLLNLRMLRLSTQSSGALLYEISATILFSGLGTVPIGKFSINTGISISLEQLPHMYSINL